MAFFANRCLPLCLFRESRRPYLRVLLNDAEARKAQPHNRVPSAPFAIVSRVIGRFASCRLIAAQLFEETVTPAAREWNIFVEASTASRVEQRALDRHRIACTQDRKSHGLTKQSQASRPQPKSRQLRRGKSRVCPCPPDPPRNAASGWECLLELCHHAYQGWRRSPYIDAMPHR